MINIHDNQKYKKKINFYSVSYNIILKYQNISHQCDFFYNWSKRTIVIDVFLFFLTDKINGLRLPFSKIGGQLKEPSKSENSSEKII
mgnify:CR=1 FL=1